MADAMIDLGIARVVQHSYNCWVYMACGCRLSMIPQQTFQWLEDCSWSIMVRNMCEAHPIFGDNDGLPREYRETLEREGWH